MKGIVSSIFACALAISSSCSFAGSGFVFDGWKLSQIYICSSAQSAFQENISLKIVTGGEEKEVVPNANSGYDPSVFLGDFLGNGLNQIFYSVESGGSGGYSFYQLFSAEKGEIVSVFDSQNISQNISATMQGDIINIEYLGQTLLLDASKNDLSGAREVTVSPINTILPLFSTAFDRYQMLVYQKVYVDYTANNVGYVTTLLDFSTGQANVVNVGVALNFDYAQTL